MGLSRFSTLTKDELQTLKYSDLTVSELELLIAETSLNDIDKKIARYRLIKDMSQDEIAYKMGYDSRTISRHIRKIRSLLHYTLIKIVHTS